MKTIISLIEGYSASLKPEEKTISAQFKPILSSIPGEDEIIYRELKSRFSRKGIKLATSFITENIKNKNPDNLLICGKSLGGVATFRTMKVLYKKHKDLLNTLKKIVIIFIDAYGRIFGDFNLKPYGNKRPIIIPEQWKTLEPDVMTFGFYQRNKYPEGANIENSVRCTELQDEDHYSIISNKEIKNRIKESFNWFYF